MAKGDPYWLTTRFAAKCARCGQQIRQGASAFYFPRGRSLFCSAEDCGKRESAAFEAAAADERFMGG